MTQKMNVLVIGSGAREHALAWALSRSAAVETVHAAPGNPGMRDVASIHPVQDPDFRSLLPLIGRENIRMAVIGPEAPLATGLADDLRAAGILVFGPGREGALLEGSKSHAKKFMDRHGIPTARWDLCTTAEEARRALDSRQAPFVVKADGLAAGKGVVVTQSKEEALDAAKGMLERGRHGEAGKKIVIEDGLAGDELTILALTDGTTYRLLSPSQDHKRAFDGDKGPNTGGMGAYSPVPWVGGALLERICRRIISPTVEGLKQDGISYCGVIYAGLMIDSEGEPSVIEYNVRFGDPEAQVVLPVLEGDFAELILACCENRLSGIEWKAPSRWAVDVVIASGGYPGQFEKGKKIEGLEKASALEDFVIFHGGTELSHDGCLVTSGGRVLSAVGIGKSLPDALKKAYEGVSLISFDGMHFRSDIGRKALL